MIIKGMIATNEGPVDIAELKVGDKIINQMHRAVEVHAIEHVKTKDAYTFEKNPRLIIDAGTVIKTMYGDTKVENVVGRHIYMAHPNMRMIKDKAVKLNKGYDGYKVMTVGGGGSIFASNYCLGLEDSND